MYIPTNDNNELVYGYDVNSLYPYVMANFPMPVGNKTYFCQRLAILENINQMHLDSSIVKLLLLNIYSHTYFTDSR